MAPPPAPTRNNCRDSCQIRLILRDMLVYWRTFVLIFAPLLLMTLPLAVEGKPAKCAFVLILMAVYWVAEVAPIPVVAFLPIVFFPLLGVLKSKDTCAEYLKDTNFIFVGGLIMALALEESNLHTRIALRVLLWMGDEPRWLMLGFMGTTSFLSMWISNTAATAMMIPIAIVILDILVRNMLDETMVREMHKKRIKSIIEGKRSKKSSRKEAVKKEKQGKLEKMGLKLQKNQDLDEGTFSPDLPVAMDADLHAKVVNFEHLPDHLKGLCKATLLCIAYGASLGGTGTMTGTGPNLIFTDALKENFLDKKTTYSPISFATWSLFAVPTMILCVFFGWAWLVIYFMGWRALFGCCSKKKKEPEVKGQKKGQENQEKGKPSRVQEALKKRHSELGNMTFGEISVIFWLVVLVLLWVFREPRYMRGWDAWFGLKEKYSSDACAGMLISFILFVYPNRMPDLFFFRHEKNKKPKLRQGLVTWNNMQQKFPWGVIVLLGGGFALAEGSKKSELSKWIRLTLTKLLGTLPRPVIALILLTLVTFFTEIASNSATASIFTPIVMNLAPNIGANPLYFGLPVTIASSFAFMLPVATVPNAIVYETKLLKMKDMVIAGLVMNFLCMAVMMLSLHTWTYALFDLGTFPDWATTPSPMPTATAVNATYASSTASSK